MELKVYPHPETGEDKNIFELAEEFGIAVQRLRQTILRHGGNTKSAIERIKRIDTEGLAGSKVMARILYTYKGAQYSRSELYELTDKKVQRVTFFSWVEKLGVEKAMTKMECYAGYARRCTPDGHFSTQLFYSAPGATIRAPGEYAEGSFTPTPRKAKGIKDMVNYEEENASPSKPPKNRRAWFPLVVQRGLELGRIKCAETMRTVNLLLCETCHIACFKEYGV